MIKHAQLVLIVAILIATLACVVAFSSCSDTTTGQTMQRRIEHCRALGGQPYLEVNLGEFFLKGCLLK